MKINEQIIEVINTHFEVLYKNSNSTKDIHKTLWEIVCDELDIDEDDEQLGNIFESYLKKYIKWYN